MYRKVAAIAGLISLILAFLLVRHSNTGNGVILPNYADVLVVVIPAVLFSLAFFTPRKRVAPWVYTAGIALFISIGLYMGLMAYSFSGSGAISY